MQGSCLFLIWLTLQAGLMISPVPDAATGNAFLISLSVANIVLLISPMLLAAVVGLQMIPASFRQRVSTLLRQSIVSKLMFVDAGPAKEDGGRAVSSSSFELDDDNAVDVDADATASVRASHTSDTEWPLAEDDSPDCRRVPVSSPLGAGDVELTRWHPPTALQSAPASSDDVAVLLAGLESAGAAAGTSPAPASSWEERMLQPNPLQVRFLPPGPGSPAPTTTVSQEDGESRLRAALAAATTSAHEASRHNLELTDEIVRLKAQITALEASMAPPNVDADL